MATIATHNGGSHRVRQGHNIRQKHCVDKEPHINPDGIHETWIHEWVRDAYKRIFGEAQDRYNATQERADRQIKDYYSNVHGGISCGTGKKVLEQVTAFSCL